MYGKALAVGSLVLAAAIAGSSDATASKPALTITSTPTQTLETEIVGKTDVRTGELVPELRLGTATFEVVVANPGDVDLADVAVVASASPTCNRHVGTLAAGASFAYTCRAANIGRNFTTRLDASGRAPQEARTLASTATSKVTVKAPKKRKSRIPHFPPLATG